MAKEVLILAFEGKKPCFLHALLNALDMHEKGFDVSVVLEGQSPSLLKEITLESDPLFPLYNKAKSKGLIKAVCYGCSKMMGALEIAEREGLPLNGDMSNHVPLAPYIDRGATVITF
ncbi:MAG TPA: hypothetical protein PLT43_02430 [Mesotoga sp.]|nr:hypothetical protein [Mesotoga sp.]